MLPRPLARRPAAQAWRPNNRAAMNLPGLRDQTARPEKIHVAAQVLPSERTPATRDQVRPSRTITPSRRWRRHRSPRRWQALR